MFTSWISSSSLAECTAGNSRAIFSRGQKALEGLDLSPCSSEVPQIPAPESWEPLSVQGDQALSLQGCGSSSQQTSSGTGNSQLQLRFFLIIVS